MRYIIIGLGVCGTSVFLMGMEGNNKPFMSSMSLMPSILGIGSERGPKKLKEKLEERKTILLDNIQLLQKRNLSWSTLPKRLQQRMIDDAYRFNLRDNLKDAIAASEKQDVVVAASEKTE